MRRLRRLAPLRSAAATRDARVVLGAFLTGSGVAILLRTVAGWGSLLGIGAVAGTAILLVLAACEGVRLFAPAAPLRFVDLIELDEVSDRPLRQRHFTANDFVEIGWAVPAGGAFAEVLRVVLHQRSVLGVGIVWYLAALGVFFVLVRDRAGTEAALDRLVTAVVWSVGALALTLLVWMLWFLVVKGLPKLSASFFGQDLSKVGPLSPGGGAGHAIVGTFEQVGLATTVVVPIAILTAVYLHEVRGVLARPVRFIVDAMSGLPSIVAGLLVFTVWVDGHGFSGVAGSAALVVLMLPTVTRASEEMLRTVPDALREGAYALGAPQWRLVQRIVVPTARSGLVTASILGVARGIGETAPMLLTAFGNNVLNTNPFHGAQADLPLFVFSLIRVPSPTQNSRGYTGALVLVLFVLVLFVTARLVASRGQRKLGRVR